MKNKFNFGTLFDYCQLFLSRRGIALYVRQPRPSMAISWFLPLIVSSFQLKYKGNTCSLFRRLIDFGILEVKSSTSLYEVILASRNLIPNAVRISVASLLIQKAKNPWKA